MQVHRHAALLVIVTCLFASVATAQTLGGSDEPILFTADEVSQDQELGTILARGHVEITQGKRILVRIPVFLGTLKLRAKFRGFGIPIDPFKVGKCVFIFELFNHLVVSFSI